jgi:hypothetical protein
MDLNVTRARNPDPALPQDAVPPAVVSKAVSNGPTSGPGHWDNPGKPDPLSQGLKTGELVREGGYEMVEPTADITYKDIKIAAAPGDKADGYIQFETNDGKKHVVAQVGNPSVYAAVQQHYLDAGRLTIDLARERAGLPAAADTDVYGLETDIEVDDHKLKVGDAAYKLLIDDYKDRKLDDGSDEAKLMRMLEARSAVTNGKFVKPVYENRNISVGGVTITETENLTKLEASDMGEILDESAINREIEKLMRSDTIAKDFSAKLDEAIGKVPESDRKALADNLAKVVESPDYVNELGKLPSWDKPRGDADVKDSLNQLSLLDKDRAADAGQRFAANALAHDFNDALGDASKVGDEEKADGVADALEAVDSALGSIETPGEVSDTIKTFLKGDDQDKLVDVANVAAELRANGYDRDDIDRAFDKIDFKSDGKDSIRGLVDKLSSSGTLPGISGAIGVAGVVRQIANGETGTAEEKMAIAGGVVSFLGSLPDMAKLVPNLIGGIDGSALSVLGVGKDVQAAMGVKPAPGNDKIDAIQKSVAATDIPETQGLPNADKIRSGLEGAVAPDAALSGNALSRSLSSVTATLSKYTGIAGGVMGAVTGVLGAKEAFSGDKSAAERAEAVLNVISGTADLAASSVKGVSSFVSTLGGGSSAGTTAARVLGAIARGLPIVGLIASTVGALVGVFVDDANSRKDAKEQYDWFKTLGDDGVTRGDWNLKYDYAVTTLANFDSARSYVKNVGELRDHDWGGRQAPKERSIFDFHREEFNDFRTKWEKDRGADTYVEFLDADKREADFKREKDQMDEVEQYKKDHPTYFPGYNDWVLDL